MTIAILAHDSRKELALQFCTAYSGILSRNTVIATGTTGRMLNQASPGSWAASSRSRRASPATKSIWCCSSATRSRRTAVTSSSRTCSACVTCTVYPSPPTLQPPKYCCAVWIRATWTTARGCTPLLWSRSSRFPAPCAEADRLFDLCIEGKNSAAEGFEPSAALLF